MRWHELHCKDVLEKLNSNPERGISDFEFKKRIAVYGKNTLPAENKNGFLKKLVKQLSDFMVITLLVAAIISFVISFAKGSNDYIDALIILFIVILNTSIGILQENKAEKAIESLKRLSSPHARVIRNGKKQKIPSENLVPGDILVLRTGDFVCADARILESFGLGVEESSLTGESFTVFKNKEKINKPDIHTAEKNNMIFSGSVVTAGNARAVVTETGINTQVGKIASLITEEKKFQTPLSLKLASTGKIIGIFIIAVSIAVFVLGIMQNINIADMLMISVSLAVAAIPEGLPAVVTIVLAGGVRNMAAKNTIVRNLPAVETLGHAGVICSDKTGTLTMNKMKVKKIWSALSEEPLNGKTGYELFTLGALCNNSVIVKKQNVTNIYGDPTENAILEILPSLGLSKKELESKFKRVNELPFDSSKKFMATAHVCSDKSYLIIIKGAPDVILKKCKYYKTEGKIQGITEEISKSLERAGEKMSEDSLRVIAAAYKVPQSLSEETLHKENEFVFVGLIGMEDPVRPEAVAAIKQCKKAGIKPVMITGDHAFTAKSVASALGMADKNSQVITGAELSLLKDDELEKIINKYSVFARVSPEHKVRIIKAFQKNGEVVAMAGDGVNDAPALKAADIGCAMGKSGTDAAKSASDIVMADDNFSTILEAVRQGRGMFENIKKTIHFLISTNIGEVMAVFFAFLIKVPTPLLAVQLLWINMVTDAFPGLALGVQPIDGNIMNRKFLSSKNNLFSGYMIYNIVIEGCFIAAIGLLSYTVGRVFFDIDPSNPIIGRTMAFVTLGLSQLMHAFNVQSRESLFATGLFSNMKLIYSVALCVILQIIAVTVPVFTVFFKTQPLNFYQWIIVVSLAVMPVLVSETEKYFEYKYLRKNQFNFSKT